MGCLLGTGGDRKGGRGEGHPCVLIPFMWGSYVWCFFILYVFLHMEKYISFIAYEYFLQHSTPTPKEISRPPRSWQEPFSWGLHLVKEKGYVGYVEALSQLPFLDSPLTSSGLRASCFLLYWVSILSSPFSFGKGWKDLFKNPSSYTSWFFFFWKRGRDNFGRQRGYVGACSLLLKCVYVATWLPFMLVLTLPFKEITVLIPKNSSTPSCLCLCRFFYFYSSPTLFFFFLSLLLIYIYFISIHNLPYSFFPFLFTDLYFF